VFAHGWCRLLASFWWPTGWPAGAPPAPGLEILFRKCQATESGCNRLWGLQGIGQGAFYLTLKVLQSTAPEGLSDHHAQCGTVEHLWGSLVFRALFLHRHELVL
jgi:hypothetical protein